MVGVDAMTDRELLELAAKAAGYWNDLYNCYEGPLDFDPLTDDGQAIRLAVKLGLFNDEDFVAELKAIWMYSCTDYYAATRRAIVCAAAEIGRAMP